MRRLLAVAPMMDWTDRHYRYFLRLISHHTLLYTEMVTSAALLHGDAAHLLRYDPVERPLALQLGGAEPEALARCAALGERWDYDEINLNVGCPSDRVQSGRFGACLMAEPRRVAECVAAMRERVALPVTVKTRIGIDDRDSYDHLAEFVGTVAEQGGCEVFIIHARKAWLQGLSPKENREIPPLRYDVAARLKQDFPHLTVVLNGGITNLDQAEQQLATFDGVMIGRAAYHDPYLFASADQRFYDSTRPIPTRADVMDRLLPYVERELAGGARLSHITRHILGLYQGVAGARAWRRHLSEHACRVGAGLEVLREAARLVAV